MRKIINDPVHGFITIEDDLIFELMAHPFFQRLRRIKQMALASLVYPGAVHTRLHHVLGAYHLMHLAIDELKQKNIEISADEEQAVKIAILLHDIGHGPFSHALEHTIVDVNHEQISLLIMEKLNKEMQGKLSLAIQIFTNQYPKHFLHQLVSSQLDVDRLDYLARDSFFSGVSEGIIGYARIIKMLTVHNDELVVEEKGIHSIEKFLIARRLMYSQVYLHKTVLSAELLLVQILKRAKELTLQKVSLFATPSLHFFLENNFSFNDFMQNNVCLENFLALDDNDIMASVKVWSMHEDVILSDLSTRLIDRKLFKVRFLQQETTNEIDTIKHAIQQQFALDAHTISYYFIQDETFNSTYKMDGANIKILFKNNELKDISQVENTIINDGLLVATKKPYICYVLEKK